MFATRTQYYVWNLIQPPVCYNSVHSASEHTLPPHKERSTNQKTKFQTPPYPRFRASEIRLTGPTVAFGKNAVRLRGDSAAPPRPSFRN
ncbi:hypothetical protein NPIL_59201 [Nephila pilipes]|uniref:Uncharacterized protein n=1 Tax=Nephila pilipes TaxID=299642 RepID=A0A8X6PUB4_NEPPI|nr:hypothetical protein NPIL_59201 [Nephila pilipes]